MVNWLIIVGVILIGYFIIKMGNLKHKFWMFIILLVALFLYLSMVYVNKQNNLDFTTAAGISRSIGIYWGWLANGFSNMKSLTGNAINMDWSNVNGSFANSSDGSSKTTTNPNAKASARFV